MNSIPPEERQGLWEICEDSKLNLVDWEDEDPNVKKSRTRRRHINRHFEEYEYFIVQAKAAIPVLLGEVERLEGELQAAIAAISKGLADMVVVCLGHRTQLQAALDRAEKAEKRIAEKEADNGN